MLILYVHTEASRVCVSLPRSRTCLSLSLGCVKAVVVTLFEHVHLAHKSAFVFLTYAEQIQQENNST